VLRNYSLELERAVGLLPVAAVEAATATATTNTVEAATVTTAP
jgi:hypothetical protein